MSPKRLTTSLALLAALSFAGCEGGCEGCRKVSDTANQATDAARKGADVVRSAATDLAAAAKVPERIASAKNLRQIAAALRAYHDAHGSFPPAVHRGADGAPLLSWRVLILPHLGVEDAKLFEEFKLDEPWDSPHNRRLLPRMPKVYWQPRKAMPSSPSPGDNAYVTPYRVFTGPGTIFEEGKRVTLADITDAHRGTVLVVEAAESVPWTAPESLVLVRTTSRPATMPALGFLDYFFLVVYADGTVDLWPRATPAETLAAMLTIAGGEALSTNSGNSGSGGGGFDFD